MKYASRNDAQGFAERTRKNLQAIEKASARDEDVHVVTQLVTSLLGLIVFLWEKHFVDSVEQLSLNALIQQGWPKWEIFSGSCETLGQLVRHLRNAVAHGHMRFSSESRIMDDVEIEVEDYKPQAKVSHWAARIRATELRDFCLRFIDLLDQTIG